MHKQKYQRYGKEYWQQHINQCRTSGLSQKEFCRQNNISFSTFTNWKTKLERESLKKPVFVEVPHDLLPSQSGGCIELSTPDGISIKVNEDIPVSALEKIFIALRGISC